MTSSGRIPIDRDVDGVRYQYTVHPPERAGDHAVFAIVDRDAGGPCVAQNAGSVLRDLFGDTEDARWNLLVHRNGAGEWSELAFEAPVSFDASEVVFEPLGAGVRTETEAVTAVRDKYRALGGEPGPFDPKHRDDYDPASVEIIGMTIAKGPEAARERLGLTRPACTFDEIARDLGGSPPSRTSDRDREPGDGFDR